MLTTLFVVFGVLLVAGAPVAVAMGASAALVLALDGSVPLMIVPQRMANMLNNFLLLAVPLFILSGEVMEAGGLTSRLIRFANCLVGHLRGGIAHASIVASMIFAGVSGSSIADISAVGGMTIPAMIKKGFKPGYVAALQASAGAIGPIIPPSIIMLVYASIAEVSVAGLFFSGLVPGVLIGLGLMAMVYVDATRMKMPKDPRATPRELVDSFIDASWALVMPVIILGGIVFGVFTATEAAAVAVVYSLLVGFFVYRELHLKDMGRILVNSARTTATVMFIASCAGIFGWVLAKEDFSKLTINFLLGLSTDPTVILLVVMGFLLVLGFFVEALAAAIILIPVLSVLPAQFGYDPIHFALIVCMMLVIGAITPPVGVNLFVSSALCKVSVGEASRYVLFPVSVMLGMTLLVALVPDIPMWLPRVLLPPQYLR